MSIFRQETLACPCLQGQGRVRDGPFDQCRPAARPARRDPGSQLPGPDLREVRDEVSASSPNSPTTTSVGASGWRFTRPTRPRTGKTLEAQAQATYDKAFGDAAPAAARLLGKRIVPRLVFGWAALREKLVAREADLDDREVELVKLALLRGAGPRLLGAATELRLVAVEADDLIMAWLDIPKDEAIEMLRVPRALYDGIAGNDQGWQPLRHELGEGLFVDMQRLLLKQAA